MMRFVSLFLAFTLVHSDENHVTQDAPVRIYFPSSYFTTPHVWRNIPLQFDKELTKRTTYTKLQHAQDFEDVFLYENWFYGMTNGIILESGAYDGVRFSTSFMFSHFANWSSVHVGNQTPLSLPLLIHSHFNDICRG
jgi:hypothetical protein